MEDEKETGHSNLSGIVDKSVMNVVTLFTLLFLQKFLTICQLYRKEF